MPAISNPRVYFHSVSQGYPVAGETLRYEERLSMDVEHVPLNGGFLTKNLWISLDPYLRGRLRDAKIKMYLPAFEFEETIQNTGIGVVIRSEIPEVKVGDHVLAFLPFEHYTVHPPATIKDSRSRVLRNEEDLPWSVYLGIAGCRYGETGFMGLKEYVRPKKSETIYVSTAADPVGQMVCQLSTILGLRVLTSAGSDEKVEYCRKVLKVDRVDIYWDNVGDKMLEDAIAAMNVHGRIIVCGAASEYNGEDNYGIKNLQRLIYWRIQIMGFVINDLRPKYSEDFYATVPKMVKSGELQYSEEIVEGLDKADLALIAMLKGDNIGKVVVTVEDE